MKRAPEILIQNAHLDLNSEIEELNDWRIEQNLIEFWFWMAIWISPSDAQDVHDLYCIFSQHQSYPNQIDLAKENVAKCTNAFLRRHCNKVFSSSLAPDVGFQWSLVVYDCEWIFMGSQYFWYELALSSTDFDFIWT